MLRASVRLTSVAIGVATTMALSLAPVGASERVERAERRLERLGCAPGPVDGQAGRRSRAATIRFQAANALGQTGRLDRRTRARLAQGDAVRCDDRPVAGSGKGRRVVISQRQNYVWLVRANGTVAAQGGMVDNPGVLSTGRFRVGSVCGRTAKIRMNSDYAGDFWLPFFTRFAPCGVGFHQIPLFKSDGRQLHPDWMLGTDMRKSHGCIRVSRGLATKLWTFARAGTRVVVL